MGIGKICFGASLIFEPPLATGLRTLTQFYPLHCWAWVWILAGAATFICAWLKFGQDGWGFVAASVPPTLWAFAYGWAGLLGDYPRGLWVFAWYINSHCGIIWWASRTPPGGGHILDHREVAEGRPG
ncbi:hypothetical protein [Streptomyces sp. NPDC048272]|uniref:hypothetical protein n=1 Tax=Streptomyces sp. NPDC048272 TaxID=3154616 RepID=UPI00342205AC